MHYTSHAVCCDACGENSENWVGVSYVKATSLASLRSSLRALGWLCTRTQDLCPKCKRKAQA